MNTKLKGCLLSLILLVAVTAVHAQTRLAEANTSADMDSAIILDSVPIKRNFFRKFLNYFNDANKEKKNKKFDFSIFTFSYGIFTPCKKYPGRHAWKSYFFPSAASRGIYYT